MALVRALGEIGDRSALVVLRAELRSAEHQSLRLIPPLADALTRLGDHELILPLADQMERLESAVGRKQIAHAIGTLLGVGDTLYGLLSRDEFSRDTAVARLLQEMQRQHKTAGGGALRTALNTYTTGDYTASVRALHQAAQETEPAHAADADDAERRNLMLQLLEHLAASSDRQQPQPGDHPSRHCSSLRTKIIVSIDLFHKSSPSDM